MDVNFFAMVEVSRLATRLMARNKCGAVVNIASVAGIEGDSRLDYSASKAAVIAATKKMARELISVGIRVNALAPGFTDTDLVSGLSEKVTQEQLGRILMHRKARPEEIAGVAGLPGQRHGQLRDRSGLARGRRHAVSRHPRRKQRPHHQRGAIHMTNLEKYVKAFSEALEVPESDVPALKYGESDQWDSVGHMTLIAALEDAFDIMVDMDDIIDLSSFEKGKEILRKYDVEI